MKFMSIWSICEKDENCNCIDGEGAWQDGCGKCIGGTTGLEENYNMDCTGLCFGDSAVDDCGICSGGDTGLDSNDVEECTGPDLDCNCECYGDADFDGCDVCCGGNSETDCSYFNDDSDFGGAYDCLENCPEDVFIFNLVKH